MTDPFRYLSVCSGIEAATVAIDPIRFDDGGKAFQAVGFSEIEKNPSSVLKHRFGSNMPGDPFSGIPNYGDFTKIDPTGLWIEVLIGGTPCQGYSVAGQRGGQACDPRARLTLEYVNLLDRIDDERTALGELGCVAWWENVPGVLSMPDNSFGNFLAALCGESEPLTPARCPTRAKATSGGGGRKLGFKHLVGESLVWSLDPREQSSGVASTPNFSVWHNLANGCSLSQVLETSVSTKYYLSSRACAGILRRAEKRGKELPALLKRALEGVAGNKTNTTSKDI